MLFRRNKPQSSVSQNGIMLSEILEEVANLEQELTDIQKESGGSISSMDREDIGWVSLTNMSGELHEVERQNAVRLARVHAHKGGITKQINKLYTNFGVGTGLTFSSGEEGVTKSLERFWWMTRNRRYTSVFGQQLLSRRACTDGEIFFALFPKRNGSILRVIDPMQIKEVISDPEDADNVLYYHREYTDVRGKLQTQILRNWTLRPGSGINPKPGISLSGQEISIDKVDPASPLIMHLLFEGDVRGEPITYASSDWTKAHRVFMRSRIAIQSALARIAMKVKVKGGRSAVEMERTVNARRDTSQSTDTLERAQGRTRVENENTDMKAMPQETGATAAQVDGGMLLQMAGIGSGIFPHYLGAGEAFRLATATAMEPPMLKAFESYMALWREGWTGIFDLVLEADGIKSENQIYEIVYPPIYPRERKVEVSSVKETVAAFPFLAQSDTFMKSAIAMLGYGDPEVILGEVNEAEAAGANNAPGAKAKFSLPGTQESRHDSVMRVIQMLERIRE